MQEFFKNEEGKKDVAVIASYAATKEVIEKIKEFALSNDKKGKRNSYAVFAPKYENVKPFRIYDDKADVELDYYPLTVVWIYDAYYGGREHAFQKFGSYEV